MTTYLDTEILIYLRTGTKKLTQKAKSALGRSTDLRISPIVVLELQMLRELGRLHRTIDEMLATMGSDYPIRVCELPFTDVVQAASSVGWTRDPFDRIVVAQTIAGNGQLISDDTRIRTHFSQAIWD